jgi:hypothetical protein
LALGPGLVACAVLATVEFGGGYFWPLGLISSYAIALVAFLPGLPAMAACIARAVPSCQPVASRRLPWTVAAPVALVWHIIVIDGCCRLFDGTSAVPWPLILRYSACLLLTTAGAWAVIARNQTRRLPARQQ